MLALQIAVVVSGAYMIAISQLTLVRNTKSAIALKVMPFFCGVICFIGGLVWMGIFNINI